MCIRHGFWRPEGQRKQHILLASASQERFEAGHHYRTGAKLHRNRPIVTED
jgi:hypothetical protein